MTKRIILIGVVILLVVLAGRWMIPSKRVDYTTEVKPILNKNCIVCHGGVKQKAGFSLLFREDALAATESGKPAIIPGDPDHSEFIHRVRNTDPEERMPYHHEALSSEDIDVLTRWVREGARWGEHWAYKPLKEVALPETKKFFGLIPTHSSWAKNEIDQFVESKLKEQDLKPSAKADKATLLRRVGLDVIGMPAPDRLAKKYLNDSSEKAFPELVDSLMALPQYGERWAGMWLDLARYADTKGYEKDGPRTIWRYRDWLIHAFNEDKPYDKFLVEQLAGDLLPNPADSDYIATCFHRNSMTNDEGGTNNEEFRNAAMLDRVNTTWEALLGTTFACVQCHSHPYDPFHHEDYYKFMAFFNNSRDEDTPDDYPLLREFSDTMNQELAQVVHWFNTKASPEKGQSVYKLLRTWQPTYNTSLCDSFKNGAVGDPTWMVLSNHASCRLKNVKLANSDNLIFRLRGMVAGGTWKIHIDSLNGPVIGSMPIPHIPASASADGYGWKITELSIKPVSGTHDLYFTYDNPGWKDPFNTAMSIDWLYFTDHFPGQGEPGYAQAKEKFWSLLRASTEVSPVMMDNPDFMHRPTYTFVRGNWMVKGTPVEPDVPGSLNPFPKNAPRNRLGLAEWMVSPQNPLTARTMVNRVWEQIFGHGLVETLEDLGSQGVPPTHPELLNWLSYQFMHEDHWSVKKLITRIVNSATYQQDSRSNRELQEKDPDNKYYARGARVRLSAEQIRDQALAICGVMSHKMYGPSVFPHQPKGLWLSPYNGADWEDSHGDDQYRRALYTYWKRSAPYPSMVNFDGVSRELCTARRIRTNTPLQALTTMNDSAYVDLARHLASRLQKQEGASSDKQIRLGFQLATNHDIDAKSFAALQQLYITALSTFSQDADKTCEIVGGREADNRPETAALIVVANAILNLNEVVTKT